MNHTSDIKYISALVAKKRTATGASATVDTLGAHTVLLRLVHDDSTVNTICRVRHASASTTLYASATAFSTVLVQSMATSGQKAFHIPLTGVKRYIRVLVSNVTTCAVNGVFGDLMYNRAVPPATNQGFVSAVAVAAP